MSEVVVLPIGGCGEVGLNATLIVDGRDALLIDCGALLGVDNAPGVEKAVPGFEPLFTGDRRLVGIVLTHGHEDHIGALGALLAELDVPVFGTPLTMAFARSRLENGPVVREARRTRARFTDVPLGSTVRIGPFAVELIRVTHSFAESAALSIQTSAGRILHTGDFKLDQRPGYAPPTDVERLKALGDEGVELMLSDSTNSEADGRAGCEGDVATEIERQIGQAEQRVVVSLFASHLHRIRAAVDAAKKHGRRICLLGRSLERTWQIGVAEKMLPNDATFLIAPEHVARAKKNSVVVLATGSQGEWLGALARLSQNRDRNLKLDKGDLVIISARAIPGNERAVSRIRNELLRLGVEVVHDRMAPVHCSGHAHRAEQEEMIRIVRPKNFVPVHGERSMLVAHEKTAHRAGVGSTLLIEDGDPVVLSGGTIVRGEREAVSQRAIDSSGRVMDWGDVRERNRIGRNGLIVVSYVLDQADRLRGDVAVTARGRTLTISLEAKVRRAVHDCLTAHAEDRVRSAIRGVLQEETGIGPEVEVHRIRLETPAGA